MNPFSQHHCLRVVLVTVAIGPTDQGNSLVEEFIRLTVAKGSP